MRGRTDPEPRSWGRGWVTMVTVRVLRKIQGTILSSQLCPAQPGAFLEAHVPREGGIEARLWVLP